MTYQEIMRTAKNPFGGFVNTDGDWCATRTPEEFKDYLLSIEPVPVRHYGSTQLCTAYVVFENGLKCTWNGCCAFVTQ